MVTFLNINETIRNNLNNLYVMLYKKDDKNYNKMFLKFINQLKNENPKMYKNIIGILFLDSYRLIKSKGKNRTNYENELLKIYALINDINDLLTLVEENNDILNYMLNSSLTYLKFSKKEKASLLLELEDDYSLKFNPFYLIEKMDIFKELDLNYIIENYKNNSNKAKFVEDIFDNLEILIKGNLSAFQKFVFQILDKYYEFKKVIFFMNANLLKKIDFQILELVENESIEKIICSFILEKKFLKYIIINVLEYQTSETIDRKKIVNLYNKLVSSEIKIKLKEV